MGAQPLTNPYVAGNPVTGERMFFGREDVFSWVIDNLIGRHQDHVLVLHGERRTGKTSILYQMARHLPPTYLPVLVDLQGLSMDGLDSLMWELAYTVQRALRRDHGIELPRQRREAFASHARTQFEQVFLAEIEEHLDGRQVLLMFDESHLLQEHVNQERLEADVFPFLTRLMGYPFLNFLFVSSVKLETMRREFSDVFQTALYHEISFLDPDAAFRLIAEPVAGLVQYDVDALARILALTSGHPYYIQITCHSLFARWSRARTPTITSADVDQVLADTTEAAVANLKFAWDDSTPKEQIVLSAMGECAASETMAFSRQQVNDVLDAYHVPLDPGDVTAALRSLAVRDILPANEPFAFHVDLLRRWIRQRRTVEWTLHELGEDVARWTGNARKGFLWPAFWIALAAVVALALGGWGFSRLVTARGAQATATAAAIQTGVAGKEQVAAATAAAVAATNTHIASAAAAGRATVDAIETATRSAIETATSQPTPTATATETPTATPTPTATETATPTPTSTATATATATPTPIPTPTPAATETSVPTDTPVPTPTVPPVSTVPPVGAGKIVFLREGRYWSANTQGLNQRALNVPGYGVLFSPNGLFAAWGGEQDGPITIAGYDGSDPVGVSRPGRLGNWTCIPAQNWSPNSARLAYVSGQNEKREILIADAGSGAARSLTDNWYDDDVPRWSPDSTRLAFLGNDSSHRDQWVLHVAQADGSGALTVSDRLVHRSAFSAEFSWSGDGSEIAISTEEEPKKWVIYALRADGGGERYITEKFAERLMNVHWSPNGQHIVYVTLQVEVVGEGETATQNWRWDFFVVNADGTGDRYLFTLPGEDKDWRSIRWSPDSQWLAIYDCRPGSGGSAQLVLQHIHGGQINYTINQLPGAPFGPLWSYDNRKLLVNTMDGIYASDLNGANRYQLIPYSVAVGWLP